MITNHEYSYTLGTVFNILDMRTLHRSVGRAWALLSEQRLSVVSLSLSPFCKIIWNFIWNYMIDAISFCEFRIIKGHFLRMKNSWFDLKWFNSISKFRLEIISFFLIFTLIFSILRLSGVCLPEKIVLRSLKWFELTSVINLLWRQRTSKTILIN